MCGINGFNWTDKEKIKEMNKKIKHRGPDDEGEYTDDKVTLGHVRLAIIDLTEAGHQPMFYDKKTGATSKKHNKEKIKKTKIGIVYNGEIYNYKEIKKELTKKGYKFTTNSDTEVILAAYQEWGTKCVKKFNGMWAFCIYDKQKKQLFLSRDRLGQKPLYYYYDKQKFIFSSELKGILAHKELKINKKENINKEAVELYFGLGFIPAPHSIYKKVYKLEARHNLIYDLKTNKIKKEKYWELPKYKPIKNKKKLIEEGRKILEDAVKLRMRSDVPVGAFLSGGLDSTTIVGIMKKHTDKKKLHTFSIGFEGKYDETPYIKIAKNQFKTIHHHYYFKEKDFEKLIDIFMESYDEPFWDYSGFPTHKVSEIAKKHVTVALSGDGGDEIFGGYAAHIMGYRMDFIYKIPRIIRKIISKIPIKRNLNSTQSIYLLKEAFKVSLEKKEEFYSKALAEDGLKTKEYKKWVKDRLVYCLKISGGSLGEALRIHDLLHNTLQDNFLVKVDRASMRYALEVRSPFLDYRLAEYAQKIPTKYKTNLLRTKVLMREIIKDIIPKEITYRGKQGFEPPLKEWLFKELPKNYFKEKIKIIKELNKQIYEFYTKKALKEKNSLYDNYKIRLYLFIKWWEKWVE